MNNNNLKLKTQLNNVTETSKVYNELLTKSQKVFTDNKQGEIMHYPPANKEWTNSTYSYDKNYTKSVPFKDNVLNTLIRMYFNLMPKSSKGIKSRRIRILKRRSTMKRIHVSKSEIKQTSDKVTITLYTFDREKQKFTKKLFFLKKRLNILAGRFFVNNPNKTILLKAKYKKARIRRLALRYNLNFSTYPKLINRAFINKRMLIMPIYYYLFLKWALSTLGYNVSIYKPGDILTTITNNKPNHITINENTLIINKGGYIKNVTLKRGETTAKAKMLVVARGNIVKIFSLNDRFTHKNLSVVNKMLFAYLYITLNRSFTKRTNIKIKFSNLIKGYKMRHGNKLLAWLLKKQKFAMYNLYKLYVNRQKYGSLIPGLKVMIQNLYNKSVELNIVNLKYLHLNSDIFTEAVAVKLRKRTRKLLRVLKRSIKLIKIPRKIPFAKSFNYLNLFTNFRSFSLSTFYTNKDLSMVKVRSQDTLQKVINTVYPSEKSNFISSPESASINNILTTVKYKWVTGIRIEAKGRLTKRYTASRALFKFRYKGSLRNMERLNKPTFSKESASTMLLRNQIKPNIQYTLSTNKKRIGCYGIKGWISSN